MLTHVHQNTIELADIFRDYQHLLSYASDDEWKVINAITSCRTEKLGGYIYRRDNCRGLSPDKTSWIPSRKNFFVPVRKLSRVFRGKFIR